MLQAMMEANVGDDFFGEDPTVNELEEKCARMLGLDAAVFCPSGTMTNQIGIKILTQPYEEVICYKGAHIYKYEGGGLAGNSLVSVRLLNGNRGRLSVEEITMNLNNSADAHQPVSSVIALENTVVREAGSYYTLQDIEKISELARARGLKMHLDGARLFNALTETKDSAQHYGKYFDTISVCLSKGLGAPVGSVIVCRKEYAQKARRMRKAFGGGMRQAGFLAAAGIYALNHHIHRLTEDHLRAKTVGQELEKQNWVQSVMPVDTNIVIFQVADRTSVDAVISKLKEAGVLAIPFGPKEIRMVTHLDFTSEMLEKTLSIFNKISL